MCGICGKVNVNRARPISPGEIEAMRDAMLSRGPDAAGLYVDRYAGLGHRRLSIIDLEASVQPMANEDQSIWIVFNGEIYNFHELRQQLIGRGHTFRTAGDTETIIHAYEEFGADCVTRLRGMFTFAIWDARTETLLLARDRVGVKPLYYTLTNQAFLFGSELKSLVADEHFRGVREIDEEAVHSYLSFLAVPDPISIYRGVRKLPAGHTLTFRHGQMSVKRYWNVSFEAEQGISSDEWETRVFDALYEAVKIRLIADVPLGAFLSGGIDSSTVVALMTRIMDRPVKTFSIGFSDKAFNEASDARRVAEHLRTEHTELILAPSEARFVIPALLEHFDEPFADASAIPTYYVSKLARQQVTVALSGDGGDELFGGYPWRQVRPWYQRNLSRLPQAVRSTIGQLTARVPASVPGSNYLRRIDIPYERYILDAMAVFDEQDRTALYASDFAAVTRTCDPYEYQLSNLPAEPPRRSWEERMMEYDLKTYLPNDVLTKVDRMSMRVSLEAREPLLDHKLIELAARIPPRLKIQNRIGKVILKRVMAPLLPSEVLDKRKQGFSVPLGAWLRTDLRSDIVETLRNGNRHGFFNRRGVEQLTDAFFHGDDSRNYQVWTLYAFELWYENVYRSAVRTAVA